MANSPVSGTIYAPRSTYHVYKAEVVAQYSGAKVKIEINSTHKDLTNEIMLFEGTDGTNDVTLFKNNAIAYFLANDQLRGTTVTEASYIQQWIEFADINILHSLFNDDSTKIAFSRLDTHLLTRTYLVGERITLADITVACCIVGLYMMDFNKKLQQYQNTIRWFTTLINQPQFKTFLDNFSFCRIFKEMQLNTPLNDEEDDDLDEKKPNKIFAHLPKGTFNLEEFKRIYSNSDTKTVALPHFWKNFDKKNYSIWLSTYKYPEELKLTFMSCNLITGMFQRLDAMRSIAFASVIVFGKDNKSTISGLWIWRGQELPFTLSPELEEDYESYDWKKLDPDDEDTKKIITEYLSWEGEFDGKTFNQGKIFK